ncbi:MAG TPA: hypothetical protein DIC56_10640 [Rhizobium sp.]|nr:hypothetical protein [Rhizobium sp.]
MSNDGENIHATAIVAGTTGFLFIGPSGSGKSALAFSCIAEAASLGLFSALIADDRVVLSAYGAHLLARCPQSIVGLIELRYGGIAKVESLPAALVHVAVLPVASGATDRLPPENERFSTSSGRELPIVRVPVGIARPFAFIMALISSQAADDPIEISTF